MPRLLIVAGERSGDLAAGALARELGRLRPGLSIAAMGGKELEAAGAEIIVSIEKLAIMGLSDVAAHLREARRAFSTVVNFVECDWPAAVVLVDYPGFNMRLAAVAKASGVPVVYYITPQVWAWHSSRARKLARLVDRALCAFSFEVPLLRAAGVDAAWVGHPLLDRLPADREGVRARARAELEIGEGGRAVALLPGSRPAEVRAHLPVFLDAARRLAEGEAGLRFLLAASSSALPAEEAARAAEHAGVPAHVVADDAPRALAGADLAITVSGTATLEAACMGAPMVVCYRTGLANYLVGRMLVEIPCIALANIVAGRLVVPELVQSAVTPARVATEARALLADNARLSRARRDLGEVRGRLGEPGASARAAREVLACIDRAAGARPYPAG